MRASEKCQIIETFSMRHTLKFIPHILCVVKTAIAQDEFSFLDASPSQVNADAFYTELPATTLDPTTFNLMATTAEKTLDQSSVFVQQIQR